MTNIIYNQYFIILSGHGHVCLRQLFLFLNSNWSLNERNYKIKKDKVAEPQPSNYSQIQTTRCETLPADLKKLDRQIATWEQEVLKSNFCLSFIATPMVEPIFSWKDPFKAYGQ